MFLCNSFSTKMLNKNADVSFKKLSVEQVKSLLHTYGLESAVGHEDTAAILTGILDMPVECNRREIKITPYNEGGDGIIVAEYVGPRLPAGTTVLPAGAEFVFWEVIA